MSAVLFEPERGQRVPVRIWATELSDGTKRQLQRLASQPYVTLHVAAMADAHMSDGVAVGTVFATEHAVVPRALGGDLGCGVAAVRLPIESASLDRRSLARLVESLGRAIPTGHSVHAGRGIDVPDALLAPALSTRTLERQRDALARRHLGTLGGGNHFLELDRDADGGTWLLVHSGSRGLGAAIAAHHTSAASSSGPDDDLAALDTREEPGAQYVGDQIWALEFARANRAEIVRRALDVLATELGVELEGQEALDVHHNFVARERWFDRDLWIHRKGAIAVPDGARAIIPGSMGTASYLVDGLGEPQAFGSCSHGAGRVLSRKEARARIGVQELKAAMSRVAFPERLARALVEEAPSAYRDVREVLRAQEDLVDRGLRLEPMAVVKG